MIEDNKTPQNICLYEWCPRVTSICFCNFETVDDIDRK